MHKRHILGLWLLALGLASCNIFPLPPTAVVITATPKPLLTSTSFPTAAPTATATPLLARPIATVIAVTPTVLLPVIPTVPITVIQNSISCSATACVKSDVDSLRLRSAPNLDAEIMDVLAAGDALTLQGRSADQSWLYVTTQDNQTGWLSAAYIETTLSLDTIPIRGEVVSDTVSVASSVSPYVSGIGEATRTIYARGQALGNRANVFSKVGDSLTVATWVMYPLGWGQQQLGDYSEFQPVIAYFSSVTARDNNSFANTSLTADNRWTTAHVLNVNGANPTVCQAGESPLECEYRIVRPSVAIILLGTNDVADLSADAYRTNMQRIIEISIARGVIPVLTTLPPRLGFEGQIDGFNTTLADLSQQFGVPLLDYASAMREAPNGGLSADGVHPSWPPGEGNWASAVDFRGPNLQYGYTLRNLTVLYALEAIWQQVIN